MEGNDLVKAPAARCNGAARRRPAPARTLRLLAILLAGLASGAHAAEPSGSGDPLAAASIYGWIQAEGTTVEIDNDLFGIDNGDRDYTGGLSVSLPQHEAPPAWNPERWLGGLAAARGEDRVLRTLQLQVLVFSPGDLRASRPQADDRPFAGLWAATGARQRVASDGREALFASLTVGMLGLDATESVHRALHRATGAVPPAGYDHQVSAGGEPTARLVLARRSLLAGGVIGAGSDLWLTAAGSVGYLTEASVALAARIGQRAAPWWSTSSELADYGSAPAFGIAGLGRESSLEMGIRLRARAYNAFLQGQFRNSGHRLGADELETVVASAWIGVAVETPVAGRWSYRLNAQSPETRSGKASRVHYWGSLSWTIAF